MKKFKIVGSKLCLKLTFFELQNSHAIEISFQFDFKSSKTRLGRSFIENDGLLTKFAFLTVNMGHALLDFLNFGGLGLFSLAHGC